MRHNGKYLLTEKLQLARLVFNNLTTDSEGTETPNFEIQILHPVFLGMMCPNNIFLED